MLNVILICSVLLSFWAGFCFLREVEPVVWGTRDSGNAGMDEPARFPVWDHAQVYQLSQEDGGPEP